MVHHKLQHAPRGMIRAVFLAAYGPAYEHSPWIAEAVFGTGLT